MHRESDWPGWEISRSGCARRVVALPSARIQASRPKVVSMSRSALVRGRSSSYPSSMATCASRVVPGAHAPNVSYKGAGSPGRRVGAWRACETLLRLFTGRVVGNACRVGVASCADPRDPSVLRRVYEIRGEVRRKGGRPNDGRCGDVTAALEAEFGWQGQYGYLRLLDDTVSWVHCWNRLADGTIVDATADQFQGLWLGDGVTVDPSSPMSANYRHAPRQWEFHIRRDPASGRIEHLTCVSEDDRRVTPGCGPGFQSQDPSLETQTKHPVPNPSI